MIEVKDRVSRKPNRIKITPENGTPYYATWERADEPIEVGTPINKVLFDSIEEGGFTNTALSDIDADAQNVQLSAGWTTVYFTKPFPGIPRVFVTAPQTAFMSVKNITRTSCQIAAQQLKTATAYTAKSSGGSANTQITYFSGVEFIAAQVDILAVYDGGYTV